MRITWLLLSVLISLPTFAEEPIKIGAIFSLSGFGALGGKEELNGLEMARDEINQAGGINKKQVKLVVEDCRSDLKSTAAAYQKLSNLDKVPVIVGPNWAEFTEVAAPLADAARLPTVSPSGWKKGLLAKHPYLYSLLPPHTVGARPLAEAINDNNFKRIGLIVSQNAFFLSITDSFLAQVTSAKVVERVELLPNTTDFRSVLSKMKTANPDVVIALMEEGGGLQAVIKQFKDLKLPMPLFVSGLMYQADLAATLSLAEGLPSLEYIAVGTPEFKRKYFERFKEPVSGGAGRAYDALYAIKTAMEQCGETRDQIQKCLPKTDFHGATGHIRFNAARENMDEAPLSAMLIVKNGKYFHLSKNLEQAEEFMP